MEIALFPGSFDPITVAHLDILERSAPLFRKVIVGIGTNTSKQNLLSPELRKEMVTACVSHIPNVYVEIYTGLTVDFCRRVNALYIIRGVRTAADFEYERAIAQVNHMMHSALDTLLLLSKPEYSGISSTIVRDILRNGGPVDLFVPPTVQQLLNKR